MWLIWVLPSSGISPKRNGLCYSDPRAKVTGHRSSVPSVTMTTMSGWKRSWWLKNWNTSLRSEFSYYPFSPLLGVLVQDALPPRLPHLGPGEPPHLRLLRRLEQLRREGPATHMCRHPLKYDPLPEHRWERHWLIELGIEVTSNVVSGVGYRTFFLLKWNPDQG